MIESRGLALRSLLLRGDFGGSSEHMLRVAWQRGLVVVFIKALSNSDAKWAHVLAQVSCPMFLPKMHACMNCNGRIVDNDDTFSSLEDVPLN